MEENESYNIFDAARESGTLIEESAEQQEESTEATNDTVELTEEANNSTEGEIPETEAATEEETNSEEANEDESTDSDIVNLNDDNTTEETNEGEEESSQTIENHYSEMLGGQFEGEEDLNNHLLELESKITELEERPPEFANDAVAKLNEYVLNGGTVEQFARVQSVNIDDMNAVDILATEIMWSTPGLSKNDAIAYLEEKFPNSLDDDGNLNPNHPTLKVDANKAAQIIKGVQADDTPVKSEGYSKDEWSEMTAKEQQEAQDLKAQETEERMEAWMQPVEDELDYLKDNGLIIPLTDDKGFRFPFTMDEAYENDLIGRVDQTLMSMGTSIKDNPKAARELMQLHFRNDNFDKIVKAAAEKGANSVNEEWFKKVHNPSVVNRGVEAPASADTLPTAYEAMNKIMGQ